MPRFDFRMRALAPTPLAQETDRRTLQPGNWWISFACLQRPSRVALRDFRMWESERCRAMLPSARNLRGKNPARILAQRNANARQKAEGHDRRNDATSMSRSPSEEKICAPSEKRMKLLQSYENLDDSLPLL